MRVVQRHKRHILAIHCMTYLYLYKLHIYQNQLGEWRRHYRGIRGILHLRQSIASVWQGELFTAVGGRERLLFSSFHIFILVFSFFLRTRVWTLFCLATDCCCRHLTDVTLAGEDVKALRSALPFAMFLLLLIIIASQYNRGISSPLRERDHYCRLRQEVKMLRQF